MAAESSKEAFVENQQLPEDIGVHSSVATSTTTIAVVALAANVSGGGDGKRGDPAYIFEELLGAEVKVNPAKLREASRAGIPHLYRSTVYRYLLGDALVDKSCEMTLERMQEKDYEQLEKTFARILGHAGIGRKKSVERLVIHPSEMLKLCDSESVPFVTRDESQFANGYCCGDSHTAFGYAAWIKAHEEIKYMPHFLENPERYQRMASALRSLHVMNSEATPDDVDNILKLALVFETVHGSARDICFSVQSLYHLLTHHGNVLQNAQCLRKECGTFLMLFRATNFELYSHFVAEGVAVVEWVPGMLKTLLAGHLHEEDLLRLWDTYLADVLEHLSFPLHIYVCLAILAEMTEVLIECEKSGIIERLRHLPRIKAGNILQRAISLKESVFSKGLL